MGSDIEEIRRWESGHRGCDVGLKCTIVTSMSMFYTEKKLSLLLKV